MTATLQLETGFVTFDDGGVSIGQGTIIANVATFTTTLMPGGANTISAGLRRRQQLLGQPAVEQPHQHRHQGDDLGCADRFDRDDGL